MCAAACCVTGELVRDFDQKICLSLQTWSRISSSLLVLQVALQQLSEPCQTLQVSCAEVLVVISSFAPSCFGSATGSHGALL